LSLSPLLSLPPSLSLSLSLSLSFSLIHTLLALSLEVLAYTCAGIGQLKVSTVESFEGSACVAFLRGSARRIYDVKFTVVAQLRVFGSTAAESKAQLRFNDVSNTGGDDEPIEVPSSSHVARCLCVK
jgi:hypothetical protein